MKDTNGRYIKGSDLLMVGNDVLRPCDTDGNVYMKDYYKGRDVVIVVDSKLYCDNKEFISSDGVVVIDRIINPEWYV